MMMLRHIWYDFHHHQKGSALKPSSLSRDILPHLKDVLTSNSSFYLSIKPPSSFNRDANGVESLQYKQTSVIRTNCVDSLDRTNVAQVIMELCYAALSSTPPPDTLLSDIMGMLLFYCKNTIFVFVIIRNCMFAVLQSEIARFMLLRQLKMLAPSVLYKSSGHTTGSTVDQHKSNYNKKNHDGKNSETKSADESLPEVCVLLLYDKNTY